MHDSACLFTHCVFLMVSSDTLVGAIMPKGVYNSLANSYCLSHHTWRLRKHSVQFRKFGFLINEQLVNRRAKPAEDQLMRLSQAPRHLFGNVCAVCGLFNWWPGFS